MGMVGSKEIAELLLDPEQSIETKAEMYIQYMMLHGSLAIRMGSDEEVGL